MNTKDSVSKIEFAFVFKFFIQDSVIKVTHLFIGLFPCLIEVQVILGLENGAVLKLM